MAIQLLEKILAVVGTLADEAEMIDAGRFDLEILRFLILSKDARDVGKMVGETTAEAE